VGVQGAAWGAGVLIGWLVVALAGWHIVALAKLEKPPATSAD
tara:strand:+ start:40179 stop:40304 length:126 start_codon:yes stop_codon:yes gene_type:complete